MLPGLVLALLLSSLPGPVRAGDATRTLELVLPALELPAKAGEPVAVLVRARNLDGSPAPGLALRLDATRGTFGQVEDGGDGTYRVTYRLPKEAHPQAVLLAVVAEGARPASAVLKLLAKVDLPVRTDKPRVKVSLLLRGHTFGPVQADAQGRAKVPIEVGPGDTEATAVAVDEFGNQTRRAVQIPIPPAPRLVGFSARGGLAADGKDSAEIFLLAIEPDGSPAKELKLVAQRPAGKLGSIEPLGPGLVRVRFFSPARLDRPKLTLGLLLKGDEQRSHREFTFALSAGRPSKLVAKATPARLVADGHAKAVLELQLTDQAGNPLDGHPLALRCSPGSVTGLEVRPEGRAQAEYTAPLGLSGEAVCVAELSAEPTLRAEVRLSLEAPVPARLSLQPSAQKLPMDGVSQSRIAIEVFDAGGQPLPGVQLRIRAPLGGLDQVSEDGQGRYHATFTAPQGEQSTKVRLDVEAGVGPAPLKDSLVLELEGVEPPPPPAPWVSLGPSAAYMTNFGLLDWAGASLELDVRLPGAADVLYLGLELGYRRGWSRDTLAGGGETAVDLDSFPVHLLLLCKPLPHAPATPVIGLGGGGAFVRWAVSGPEGAVERGHAELWSSLAVLGVEIRAGRGAFSVLARYLYAYLNERAAEGGSHVRGSVGGLDVSLGYRLFF
ncbi:MAG TPA: invasin domain 3-containing protein [Myxococcota bacterium]|nr:invasin domain 3-containing protein [Myxococcota bacterium]HRY95707.1 invasin domain 3-containing protein [Myxococcota bacterium]HSA21798.1 invasin domain 3-containing protein [Myxococcota bacterium]